MEGVRHLVYQSSSDEGICELRHIPVADHSLIPVAVTAAAEISGIRREVWVKAL
jgi:hypothetical protein